MRTVIVCATAALLAACATPWHWEKPNASQYEFNMDAGACRAQAFSVPGAPTIQVALVYDGCMQGKGWYKVNG
jgi:hypothetical protein